MSQIQQTPVSSQGFEYGVKHFYNQKSATITEILLETLHLEKSAIAELLNLGAVYINNERQLTDNQIAENQLFRVHTKPRRYNCEIHWKSLIVYENEDFLIINKPSGIPSHPSVDNVIENSLTQTSRTCGSSLYITHRLDTLTAGLIVYAKKSDFVKSFNKQLQEQTIEKKYVALLETSATLPKKIIHYMEPSHRAPKTVSEVYQEGWAFCELEIIEQKKINTEISWVKINLLTGRTHQIRSQLSHLQAPIMGDGLYGSKFKYLNNSIALRAIELQFNWGNQRMYFNLEEEFQLP